MPKKKEKKAKPKKPETVHITKDDFMNVMDLIVNADKK